MKKFKVIVDSREKIPHRWIFEEDDVCCGSIVEKLYVGDYSLVGLEQDFTIERKKSVSEIAKNITESRWQGFLDRLLTIPHAFMMMEFSVDDILKFPYGCNIPKSKIRYIKVRPAFILSKIADMQLMGINIIFAGSTDNAQKLSYNLMRKIYGL